LGAAQIPQPEEKIMKKAMVLASAFACAVALTVAARAADTKSEHKTISNPESVVFDAESAFDFLKSMNGTWQRTGGNHDYGSKSPMSTFRVSGAGSSVVETIFPNDPSEMVSVYHMDGNDLLMTHYCALHNAPVMKFQKTDKPGEIKFVFKGGTNFDPKVDMHIHEGYFKIANDKTIKATFVVFNDGKPGQAMTSTMTRKDAK
jgi:hypothetical protein